MSIRCIALDLDRTTLNSGGCLSERNRKAMEQAIESGIQIAVASGRSLDSLPGTGHRKRDTDRRGKRAFSGFSSRGGPGDTGDPVRDHIQRSGGV